VPVAVGFGINTPAQAAEIGKIADGVIVGSAIVKLIEEHQGDAERSVYEYVREMKDAV
jgi:tryptophan synthase alpha chain